MHHTGLRDRGESWSKLCCVFPRTSNSSMYAPCCTWRTRYDSADKISTFQVQIQVSVGASTYLTTTSGKRIRLSRLSALVRRSSNSVALAVVVERGQSSSKCSSHFQGRWTFVPSKMNQKAPLSWFRHIRDVDNCWGVSSFLHFRCVQDFLH